MGVFGRWGGGRLGCGRAGIEWLWMRHGELIIGMGILRV